MKRVQQMMLGTLVGLTLLSLGSGAWAQNVVQDWVARYDWTASGSNHDEAKAIAVDAWGDVFVTGQSLRVAAGDWDIATVKYDSSGNQLWVARTSGYGNTNDSGRAIVVDSTGDAYVTGSMGTMAYTIKYNGSNGNAIWTKTIDGAGNDIALEFTEGSVFITGYSGANCLTVRYATSNGLQVWAKTDIAGCGRAIAVSPGGDAYITGDTGGSSPDYLTVKYGFANGARLWSSTYNGPASWGDIAHDIVVDDAANAYVTGESDAGAATRFDIVTISYDLNGAVRWTSSYNGSGTTSWDKGFAIALGPDGNVVVAGYDYDTGTGGNRDFVTIKYFGSTGMQLWVATYNSPDNRDDWGTAVAVGGDNSVYVTGYVRNGYGNDDYATIKYAPGGAQQWVIAYSGPGTNNQDDWAAAIAVDENDYVYVTGLSDGGIGYWDRDYATVRYSQPACGFTPWEPAPAITGVWKSDAQWGDFDNDGDLDLVICGVDAYPNGNIVTQTYRNQNGTLTLFQNLEGVQSESSGNLAWGDYDGDGDLDLAIAGTSASGPIARIYRNTGGGTLVWDAAQALTGVHYASVAWGDYDGDGDLDLLVSGFDGTQNRTILYQNDPLGTLTPDTTQALVPLRAGSADWGDWDGDGVLDLVMTGADDTSTRQTIFYQNNPVGALVNTGSHGLPGVALSDTAWGDCDGDGDLDLAFTGETGTGGKYACVYTNDGTGGFTLVVSAWLSVYRSSCAWGDYDNDGDLDVAFCGYDGSGLHNCIYENDAGTFEDAFYPTSLREGSLSFADVDNDGDLDFFMTGADWSSTYADLYQSTHCDTNSAPTPPASLTCTPVPDGLRLSWSGASDAETSVAGLYYCLRVGTTVGGNDIVSGTYGSPLMGNVQQATDVILDVPGGTYYWGVRTIDSGFRASAWTAEQVCVYHQLGDLNCDFRVDNFDITPFVLALTATAPNYPEYYAIYPHCDHALGDINGDGRVDNFDITPFVDLLSGP